MAVPKKIATCNYCGTRAVLVLGGEMRHELACSACGAPLHEMKMMPQTPVLREPAGHGVPGPKRGGGKSSGKARKAPPARAKKRRKPWARKAWSRLADVLEDVVDEIFD